jgi:hypothetical protein
MKAARCRGTGMQDNTAVGVEAWGTPASRHASLGRSSPLTASRGVPSRPLMRTPVVKRQTLPKSGFSNFFRCASGQAPSASGNVFRLHCRWLVHPRDCTKHFLRVSRPRDGDSRERWSSSLSPRNISVPSYRPTQTRGCTSACASEAQVRVRGSTP